MPAYLVAIIEVTDPARFAEYVKAVPAVIAKFGGSYLARAGTTEILEGASANSRVIVIEFPSFERASAFYHSADYQEVKKLRLGAATGSLVIVDGVPPQIMQ